jgi:hypothetical protein
MMSHGEHSPADAVYQLKTIDFFNRKVPILLQNSNGPCPLLAIANCLLLSGAVTIHEDHPSISQSHLVTLVAERLIEANGPDSSESPEAAATRRQTLDDAIGLLSSLERGLDVNVLFAPRDVTSRSPVLGFEFTREFSPFDLLGLELVHGWLVDPEDCEAWSVLSGLTYNHVVERLVAYSTLTASAKKLPGSKANEEEDEEKADAATELAKPADEAESAKTTDIAPEVGLDGKPDETTSPLLVPTLSKEPAAGAQLVTATTVRNAPSPDGSIEETGVLLREGRVLEAFMDQTANQLTFYGLMQLHEHLRERQLCVFFRNNHFSTIFKVNGKLYLLVTDEGYGYEAGVVWELLDDVGGDTEYCNASFVLNSSAETMKAEEHAMPVDADYMYALQLQGGAPSVLSTSPEPPLPAPATPKPIIVPATAVAVVQAPTGAVSLPGVSLPPVSAELPAASPPWDMRDGVRASATGSSDRVQEDEAYAKIIQQQLDMEGRGGGGPASPPLQFPSRTTSDDDERMARELQDQIYNEERRGNEQRSANWQRAPSAPTPVEPRAKKGDWDCAVQ